tara:strand:- start:1406 stop:1747 length:342 start_codon:yes stop_codon:yes gene_type:complete
MAQKDTDNLYQNIPEYKNIQKLEQKEEYIDKDDYDFNLTIKDKNIHSAVYSALMVFFFIITYIIFIMKKPKNSTPIFLYILYGIFVVLFYLYYFKLSVLITNAILLLYGPIKN